MEVVIAVGTWTQGIARTRYGPVRWAATICDEGVPSPHTVAGVAHAAGIV
jgi:hypothetical protein